ncbi:nuclear anchorage protein 1-like isoform X2 [Sphaeramia orbicularis]|uniref:nuclear anchorage protein 1-like isoform X2 n=1 Tax=Sphaeramia orbicularis TaxID=375764 RepID=UPI00117CF651|nr:nuclear anchorage protein 1-like isoform X2 [Sphaeramia orbicularis]
MVAGMLMPLRDLRAIYEVLFRDGVMVAKKDKRPQIKHPEVEAVTNLQVIRAMGSLKSRGYVKETFAWRHFYWYLTNEGIVYLRDYLRLPPEIVPSSLQRIRKPAATLAIAHRAARVQSVDGPTSYVPKPGRRVDAESQDALAERQGYRRRMMGPGDKESYSDRTPRFRGRPPAAEPARPKASWDMREQPEPLYKEKERFGNETVNIEESRMRRVYRQQPDVSSERPVITQEKRAAEVYKEKATGSARVQKTATKQDVSETSQVSSYSKTALPLTAAASTGAAKLKVQAEPSTLKTNKDEPKINEEEALMKSSVMSTPVNSLPDTEVKGQKTKTEVIVDAEVKAPAVPITDEVNPQVPAQEVTTILNDVTTSTKPAMKDADKGKIQEVKVIHKLTKPAEVKTPVEPQIVAVTAKKTVKQDTAKIRDQLKDDATSKTVLSTDEVKVEGKVTEKLTKPAEVKKSVEPEIVEVMTKKTVKQDTAKVRDQLPDDDIIKPVLSTNEVKVPKEGKETEKLTKPAEVKTPIEPEIIEMTAKKTVKQDTTKIRDQLPDDDIIKSVLSTDEVKVEGKVTEKLTKPAEVKKSVEPEIVEVTAKKTVKQDTTKIKDQLPDDATSKPVLSTNDVQIPQEGKVTEKLTKPAEVKTQVEPQIAEVTAKKTVKQDTAKIKDQLPDDDIIKPVLSTDEVKVEGKVTEKLTKPAEVKTPVEPEIVEVTAKKTVKQDTKKTRDQLPDDATIKPVASTNDVKIPQEGKVTKKLTKLAEVKTQVEPQIAEVTAKKTVKQDAAKIRDLPDDDIVKPVLSTDEIKVPQEPSVAKVTSAKPKIIETTTTTESTILDVKTTVGTTVIPVTAIIAEKTKSVQGKSAVEERITEAAKTEVIPPVTKAEKVEKQEILTVQEPMVAEKDSSSKQVAEASSKSKRKKKKSPGEISKNVTAENTSVTKVEKEQTIKEKLHEEEKVVQPPAATIRPVSAEKNKAEDKDDINGEQISTESEKPIKEIPEQSISQSAAVPPVEIQDNTKQMEKTEEHKVSKISLQEICPEDQSVSTLTKETTVTKVETVTVQKITKVEITNVSLQPEDKTPAALTETVESKSSVNTGKAAEEFPKSKKKGKGKKQSQASVSEPVNVKTKADALSSTEVTKLPKDAPKDSPVVTCEPTDTSVSPKMNSERMCSEEIMQAAAVLCEAPADKREVEPALGFAEKIKREVPKAKTSSSVREALAAGELASAAASASAAAAVRAEAAAAQAQAQANPLQQPEPPSVAQQHSATRAAETQERLSVSEASKKKKKDSEEDTPSGADTPATGRLHLVDTCKSSSETDEANMRKKIVVVEEIIEVKQIISPDGTQGQSPPPPVPAEAEGEELDLDVLEAIAIERALLSGAAAVPGGVYGASPEADWDHSLEEPEEKTWPNFVEDERDRVQKKTFTKWVNKHLMKHWWVKAQRHVTDLYEDLRDGHNLISLLEVLSGETLPREKGRMRFHKLQNVQIALDFLRHRQVKLVNIRNDDIADGNPKLTLGLIWTIILHFQISDIQVNGQSEDMTAKEKLLLWSQRMTDGYQGIRCDNFTTSWRDGKLFNAVIHKH